MPDYVVDCLVELTRYVRMKESLFLSIMVKKTELNCASKLVRTCNIDYLYLA